MPPTEETSLLTRLDGVESDVRRRKIVQSAVRATLFIVFAVSLGLLLFYDDIPGVWKGGLPKDPSKAAAVVLEKAPVIDGHIDLPWLVRALYSNNASAVHLEDTMPAHVDIPRLREGKVGGFFWSVYVPCPADEGITDGDDFVNATWRVRDTLEQIDISHILINKYSDTFELALTASDVSSTISRGKIASLIGVEGGHQLGNSLGVLRTYYALGVRYMTLTHTCHNAFADSCGLFSGVTPKHGGLSAPLGHALIYEMNRLGMLVDLSHTSDDTALQALSLSRAPVMWSHSSARALHDIPRNVPDSVLEKIGTGPGQRDAVVMVNFYPAFVSPDPDTANVSTIADHVEHIAKIAGREHVGLGSDFDGIGSAPIGLEDVSKYPALIAELYSRGWGKRELAGLTGANLLRVMDGAERVAAEMQKQGALPASEIYDKRPDLPIKPWWT
ncbi:hypothetical protein BV25DRAFT_1811576 [Artomyces pyxidatus]|uniref:Uncharacterized protein n=1 Tax=Artomyces pyxidatus TaxID=48021 RepID=A0ACB8SNF6_9AGAM|nr:hypothetical protein BV25DRAFT_1811576 [Artomyces pyxidatus]